MSIQQPDDSTAAPRRTRAETRPARMARPAGESLEHFIQRRPRSATARWRIWCWFWAVTWFVLGFLFIPFWALALLSVGAALIPWGGGDR